MFDNIIGNKNIIEELKKSVEKDKVLHSYLFVGNSGIGKKLIAIEFAKMILCTDTKKYCNKCKSCIEFDTNNNSDFLLIEPNGNSLKIEQIREFQKKVNEKPIVSNKKVYIINDSDKMTKEAQNCLLKTLEEPPKFVTIILIGQNENLFLNTIKSRCTILHFKSLSNNELQVFLQENYNMDIKSNMMLDFFQGSIGRALLLKEKTGQYEKVENIVKNLGNLDIVEILNMSEILYKSKDEIDEMLNYINVVLIQLAKESNKYAQCVSVVEKTKKRLNANANYDMSIDYMLFKMHNICTI